MGVHSPPEVTPPGLPRPTVEGPLGLIPWRALFMWDTGVMEEEDVEDPFVDPKAVVW